MGTIIHLDTTLLVPQVVWDIIHLGQTTEVIIHLDTTLLVPQVVWDIIHLGQTTEVIILLVPQVVSDIIRRDLRGMETQTNIFLSRKSYHRYVLLVLLLL
jgi:hypothetical protein